MRLIFKSETGEIFKEVRDSDGVIHRSYECTIEKYKPEYQHEYLALGNLIAAAPDLLEACTYIADALNSPDATEQYREGYKQLALEMVQEAIKKAKGEQL